MAIWSRLRRAPADGGALEGTQVRVRGSARTAAMPHARHDTRGPVPRPLALGVLGASLFYLLAHLSIVQGVWPVHGTAPGAAAMLVRDGAALVAWLLVLGVLWAARYRGSWAVVALPIIVFCLARPTQFQLFTDPAYQATRTTRAEANELKAERSRLSTILRAYDAERQELVFDGAPPAMPDPFAAAAAEARAESGAILRVTSYFSIVVAPLALLVGFFWARDPAHTRRFREHRRWPFAATLGLFFVLTLFFTELGKVRGTTPWELFLPVFVLVWAAVLADDVYNLARPGEVVSPRRIAGLLVYGALPVVPFLVIRELGLSIVLAGSLAVMLLVGTRRGWWAGLMLAVWAVLVFAAFNLDERSATRLALAWEPYRDLSAMTARQAEQWAAKLHQIKLFDANVLTGGLLGEGPGRGHAETAPNAADDGYVTAIAAQWGWLGTLALVAVYALFLVQMMDAAIRERGAFERTVVTGLTLLIAIPFWLATLGGLRVIPLTGVAAAFAAHGGAKLLASSLAVGIVAGISHRRAGEERLEEALGAPAAGTPHEGVRVR